MLAGQLNDLFGDRVACQFIDINFSAMKNYPQEAKLIKQVLLPVTIINGIPRLHGYLDQGLLIEAVKECLDKAE